MFVYLGMLMRAHGLKGEILVERDSPLPSRRVYLQCGAEAPRPVRVTGERIHKGRMSIFLEGVEDRTAAEALRGGRLLFPTAELPDDGVCLHQLPGLEVVLHESGRSIGVVDRVEFPAGREIWVIRAPDGREALLPAVDDFVEALDLEARRATVKPPPGLLELYLPDGD